MNTSALSPSSNPPIRRLSLRLQHLYQWALALNMCSDIWDLCCDHGRLGLHLHQHPALKNSHLHLIDNVPAIINGLSAKYARRIDHRLNIRCIDAGQIALPPHGHQLLIIAGVGGETIVSIMQAITRTLINNGGLHQDQQLHYLLSPNLNTFELRQYLRSAPFELVAEEFVSDKGWHHEHLHLRYHNQLGNYPCSSPIGEGLWADLTPNKKAYLARYIKHYRNCVEKGGQAEAKIALKAYGEVLDL